MRTTTWAGLLGALAYNQARQQDRVRLFESGLRFIHEDAEIKQETTLSGAVCGTAAAEQWGLPAEACVMVGDTLGADILAAQLAGLHSVWISSHAEHPANQAHQGSIRPVAEIRSLPELLPLLERLSHD